MSLLWASFARLPIIFGHGSDMTFVTSLHRHWLRILIALNPRRRLAAAIGWSIVAVSLLAAAASGIWTMREARQAVEREIGLLHSAHAQRLIDTIDANLAGRREWVAASATFMGNRGDLPATADARQILTGLQQVLPEIEWAGVVDPHGMVVAGLEGIFEGQSVTLRPWFTNAFLGPYVGDVHRELLLDRLLPQTHRGEPRRFVDLSAPIRAADGDVIGILALSLGWSWVESLQRNALKTLQGRPGVEILLMSIDGTVLLGSDRVPQGSHIDLAHYYRGENYRVEDGHLVGIARSHGIAAFDGLGWWVMVREPAVSAFRPADRTSLAIMMGIAASGLAAALTGAWIAGRIMRRLKLVAEAADDLRAGRASVLAVPDGQDEAARIGRSLSALVDTLQGANAELMLLNQELDVRVAARTREIERMSQETRFAAIVRERLRIARDLHDTLAHSMLALLTQIRLVRRIATTDPSKLNDELARAEDAARDGLTQARDAVMQLRYSPVRDDGLGPALRRLVQRLSERVEIIVHLTIGDDAEQLADQTSETVFRIIEEAVRNVEKHASARHLTVSAQIEPHHDGDHLVARIIDDGAGFDPDANRSGHFGLTGASEQAELIGATLTLQSAPGQGTQMQVEVLL